MSTRPHDIQPATTATADIAGGAFDVERWTRIGVLAAFAMLLSYLETFIPIPIPGVKLGLANIPILIALAQRDARGALCIAVIKVLAAGLLFGSPVMMAYSAMGTLLAFCAMAPLARIESMHLVVVSIIGALLHEAGQLLVAWAILGTPLVWYSAPVLAVAGCITGALCGLVASRTLRALDEAEGAAGDALAAEGDAAVAAALGRDSRAHMTVNAKAALIVFLVFVIALLKLHGLVALCIMLAIAAAACAVGRVRATTLAAAIRPLVAILVITFAAQLWSAQQGTVLVSVGPVAITAEALIETARMIVRLLAITGASIAFMHLVRLDDLLGAIRWLLSPLARLGVRTEGFAHALNVAIETVPLLAASAREEMERLGKRNVLSSGFWRETAPSFIAALYRSAAA